MSFRNLSPQAMFERLALEHRPELSFAGRSLEEFEAWKGMALPRVLATLGKFPLRVPANPQLLAEWEEGGQTKQRWLIDVQRHLGGISYPASKDDVVSTARANGAPDEIVRALEGMAGEDYSGPDQVMAALNR